MIKKMISRRSAALVLCAVAASALAAAGFAAEYSATTVTKIPTAMTGGKMPGSIQSKMFVKGDMIRQEHSMKGMKQVTIVRPDKGVAWMLMPSQKTYMEMKVPADQLRRKPLDQLKAQNAKLVGKQRLLGYNTDKYTFSDPKGGKVTVWYSKELGNQIKTVVKMAQGSITTEMTSIRKGRQSASLFELPKGYKKTEMPKGNGAGRAGGPPPGFPGGQ